MTTPTKTPYDTEHERLIAEVALYAVVWKMRARWPVKERAVKR